MSKPGQYLRHTWTHRSEFQKTEGYRRIDLDECTVHGAKALCSGSDDELSDSERAAKRRRIEKLAEGYLRGERLVIPSLRPCPQALKRTVVRQKKSMTAPKFAHTDLVGLDLDESTQIWQDVESDAEILQRLLRKCGSRKRAPADIEQTTDIIAQASCQPRRRLRTADISHGPSEEALQKAAALRKRRGRVAVVEMAAVTEEPASRVTPISDPAECINVTQSERVLRNPRDKGEWLSRRKSKFSFDNELVYHVEETPSSPCVAPSTAVTPHPGRRGVGDTPQRSPRRSSDHRGKPALLRREDSHVSVDAEVLQEPMEASPAAGTPCQELPHRPSNSQPLASPNVDPGERPCHLDSGYHSRAHPCESQSAPATRARAVPEQIRREYLQAPSTQNGTTPLMYRKRTTRSKTAAQQQEAMPPPATRAMAQEQEAAPVSAPAPTTRRSTRRRFTFPPSEDVPPGPPAREPKHHVASNPPVLEMDFQTDYSFAPKLNMALVEEHTNRFLPDEPRSEDHVSATKKALRREMRNSGVVFERCDSEPPTSQVEPAAEPIPAPEPGPEHSLPAETQRNKETQQSSKTSNSERRQTWQGTQAMLARAERDLFTSPEKPRGNSAFTPINEHTSRSHYENNPGYTPASQEREPRKQLSQEPATMPSTQAMLGEFEGFSTVKKPRSASAFKAVAEPTPVAAGKGKRLESRVLDVARRSSLSTSSTAGGEKDRRGSSLRFSISSFESPVAARHDKSDDAQTAQQNEFGAVGDSTTMTPGAPLPSLANRRRTGRSAMKSSSSKPARQPQPSSPQRPAQQPQYSQYAPRRTYSADDMQSEPMSVSEDFPSSRFLYQNRQDSRMPERYQRNGPHSERTPQGPADLVRDASNLSQTIDDLTRDVLGSGMKEMEGVMSQ